ncbi:hypothetical protein [Ruegeria sp.]|uniref:hypothetical protein n=1 Tax=Ruegeria sp. TaxID=1879320 RepID=UPI00231E2A67|nr:hypothetical protein [Ruegeria sp.]MDA7966226.1 hypothetical protein [Ruegeria sp.]
MNIVFSTFPRTESPPSFVSEVCDTFQTHGNEVSTVKSDKGLTSDQVLEIIRPDLVSLGFLVEAGKRKSQKVQRPVFFGENAVPSLQYEVDAWHPDWRVGLEVEAGRAKMGNAIYRDLIQALVMVDLKYLFLAVPLAYRYNSGGKSVHSKDYEHTVSVAEALYGHSRIAMPFSLCVIGY